MLAISALVFGVSFFAVVASTTAFVRFNYAQTAWPGAIAAMTIAFGIGQTLGPLLVGAITDAIGSLSSGARHLGRDAGARCAAVGVPAAIAARELIPGESFRGARESERTRNLDVRGTRRIVRRTARGSGFTRIRACPGMTVCGEGGQLPLNEL